MCSGKVIVILGGDGVAQLNPGQKVHLQYTTTSPVMHQRLGVDDSYQDEFETA